jgi:PGF-CTERM protein/surface glycoprotein (TIGR04207 family)
MTSNTNKHRAVFLAVLITLSVVAGTVVFSGSVAAVGDPRADGGDITNTTVSASSTNTHSVTLNATLNTSNVSNVNYNVSFPSSAGFDLSAEDNSTIDVSKTENVSVANTNFDTNNDNFTVNISTDGSGLDDEAINLTFDLRQVGAPSVSSTQNFDVTFALDNSTDGVIEDSTTIGTITVEGPQSSQSFAGGAVHYNNSSTSNATIEIPFDGNVNSNSITPENFTILDDGDDVSDTVVDYEASRNQHDSSGKVDLVTTDVFASNDLEVELSSQVASNDGEKSVAFAATAVNVGSELDGSFEASEFQGTTIAFHNASGVSDFEIEDDNEDSFDYFQSFSSGTNSEVFYIDTGPRELGDYNLNDPNQNLTIRDLGLTIGVDDTNVTTEDDIEGTVDSTSSNREILVELVDDSGDGDAVAERDVSTSGQGNFDFSFSGDRDAGDFTIQVTDDASGIEVESSTITISEAVDDDADFVTSSVSADRGDIAEITVEMESTDFASISFGSSDDGVKANATVEDEDGDGQVTVYLNTYKLTNATGLPFSNDDAFAVDSDSDDSVTDQEVTTNTSDLIDAGEYDLELSAGEETYAESEDGVATFTLNERNTETLRTWTGSSGELSISSLEDVNEAIANGEITQSSDIAVGDLVVHQLETSGLEGALNAREDEDVTDAFLDNSEGNITELTIEEADPGANQDAREIKLGTDNVSVIADGPNDTYYVIFDTEGSTNFDDGNALPDDDDTELETNFTVRGDDFASPGDFTSDDLDSDENEETFVEFTAEEPEVTISEPFDVSQAEGQTVSGTTNIAPGTELRLRVRSQSGTSPSFLKTSTPVVQSDGTFSATLDFSEQNVGDEYDIIVANAILASNEEESGQVVEAVATDTATPEPDTDTATPEPDTATPEPDTATPEPDTATPEPDTATPEPDTATPTSTPTSTPGFGVVVALTALLAAALLAIRRES